MKHQSIINALAKKGIVPQIGHNNQFYFKGPENTISWYKQGDSAICTHVVSNGLVADSMRDYHPGFFCRKLKYLVEHAMEGMGV